MPPFPHKIITYWSNKHNQYLSFSPHLLKLTNKFLLKHEAIGQGLTPITAFEQGLINSKAVIEELEDLGIDSSLGD